MPKGRQGFSSRSILFWSQEQFLYTAPRFCWIKFSHFLVDDDGVWCFRSYGESREARCKWTRVISALSSWLWVFFLFSLSINWYIHKTTFKSISQLISGWQLESTKIDKTNWRSSSDGGKNGSPFCKKLANTHKEFERLFY